MGFEEALASFDETIVRQVGYAETKPPNVEEYARQDAEYLRRMLAEVRGRLPCRSST